VSIIDTTGSNVVLQDDPTEPGKTELVVTGTSGNDAIVISPGNDGAVNVTINGVSQGTFKPSGRIIRPWPGRERRHSDRRRHQQVGVAVRRRRQRSAQGRRRQRCARGQERVDLLIGGDGRDMLIGGFGADRLVGNAEEDVLIAGTTWTCLAAANSLPAYRKLSQQSRECWPIFARTKDAIVVDGTLAIQQLSK
jgi:Ca2+-binding RTX toxin-like protein